MREGGQQMQRQAVLADVDAVDEARLHHVPADRALQAAQRQDAEALQRRSAPRSLPISQNTTNGTAKAMPMKRPRKRCAHSHQ